VTRCTESSLLLIRCRMPPLPPLPCDPAEPYIYTYTHTHTNTHTHTTRQSATQAAHGLATGRLRLANMIGTH
jgi:hypothetical protein